MQGLYLSIIIQQLIIILMEMIKSDVQVVWAKVKGYSWWPATMAKRRYPDKQIEEQEAQQSNSDHRIRVEFFGQNSHSYVGSKMILDFRTHYQEFSKTRNKKLLRSIRMAQEFQETIISGKNLEQKDQIKAIVQQKNPKDNTRIDQEQNVKTVEDSSHPEQRRTSILDSKQLRILEQRQDEQNQQLKNNIQMTTKQSVNQQILNIKNNNTGTKIRNNRRIPYRKFQDMKFECKIVDLLNKLKIEKNCEVQLNRLIQKLPKITGKIAFNRYIISGVATIIRYLKKANILTTYPTHIIDQIQQAYEELIIRIKNEINDISLIKQQMKNHQDQSIKIGFQTNEKRALIKNIYRLLRQKKLNGRNQCQEISIKLCENLQGGLGGARYLLKQIADGYLPTIFHHNITDHQKISQRNLQEVTKSKNHYF